MHGTRRHRANVAAAVVVVELFSSSTMILQPVTHLPVYIFVDKRTHGWVDG